MKVLFVSILIAVLSACSSSEQESPSVCISFDTRQCQGDPWSEVVDRNGDSENQVKQLKAYFDSQGIEVKEVKVDLSFHEFTCEACIVCPENPRIFVRAEEEEVQKLQQIELLNPEIFDCGEF